MAPRKGRRAPATPKPREVKAPQSTESSPDAPTRLLSETHESQVEQRETACYTGPCPGCGVRLKEHACPAQERRALTLSAPVYNEAGETLSTLAITASRDSSRSPEAKWVPAGPNSYAPGRFFGIEKVVIHVVPEGVVEQAVSPESAVSFHHVVMDGGAVVEMVDETDTAFHAGDWSINQRSIGIGMVNTDDPDITAVATIVADLTLRYGPVEIVLHHCAHGGPLGAVHITSLVARALEGKHVIPKALTTLRDTGAVLWLEPARSADGHRAAYPAGTVLTYSAEVQGEPVDLDTHWVRLAVGLYVWRRPTTVGDNPAPSALAALTAQHPQRTEAVAELDGGLGMQVQRAEVPTAATVAVMETAKVTEIAATETVKDPRDVYPEGRAPVVGGTGSRATVGPAGAKIRNQPLLTAQVLKQLPAGAVIDYRTQVVGSNMDGINSWLMIEGNQYVWSGDVTL